jgi:hypothetical protein
MRNLLLPVLLAGFMAPMVANAATFRSGDVPADARWLLHIDLDAIASAEALQKTYEERVAKHPFVRSLAEGRWKVKIDFQGELKGVTLYGKQLSQNQGVLLLYTDAGNGGQPPGGMPDLPGEKKISYHSHQLHTWSWSDEEQVTLAVAFPRSDLAVWAGDVGLLMSALDVLDGRVPSLEEEQSVLATNVPEGAMFLVGATKLQDMDLTDGAPLIENLKAFHYVEGLRDAQWFSDLTAITDSPEANRHMKSVVDGMVSAFWLFSRDDEESQDVTTHFKVSADGPKLRVQLAAPLEELTARFGGLWQWMYSAKSDGEEPATD